MKLQFLGSGDAFASGGRFNACFHLTGQTTNLLIDCGATSLVAMRNYGVEPNDVQAIAVTHFHADHFGGIPFFILDAQLVSKRRVPLTIVGPQGLVDRYRIVMEAAFVGSSEIPLNFDLVLQEVRPGASVELGTAVVRVFQGLHDSIDRTFHIYRFELGDKTLAYTGDTAWTDEIIRAGRGADLLIAEAYYYEKSVRNHLSLKVLEARLGEIGARRVILTHMSTDMLSRISELPYEFAIDGKIIELD